LAFEIFRVESSVAITIQMLLSARCRPGHILLSNVSFCD
jgi:hypothetical protein